MPFSKKPMNQAEESEGEEKELPSSPDNQDGTGIGSSNTCANVRATAARGSLYPTMMLEEMKEIQVSRNYYNDR